MFLVEVSKLEPKQNATQQALDPLIGLKLSLALRAMDMRIFHFGYVRRHAQRGEVGKYALHIQCPWRIDRPEGTVTGRLDLCEHISGEQMLDEWEPGIDDNIQDVRLAALLQSYNADTRSHVNTTDILIVERVNASTLGDATIDLSGGYRLTLFPAGTASKAWRIFRPGDDDSHFVVEGEQPA